MFTIDQEIDVLTQATLLAGAVLSGDPNENIKYLPELNRRIALVSKVKHPLHERLKREVELTANAAMRYLKTKKQSDAKLTRRHGAKVADEFARLKRQARRGEAK